ncbi:MAG: hypothetical protein J6J36_07055 [Clostridia bacterium]|nr:hypothetical protein [Clostridia bacterium]
MFWEDIIEFKAWSPEKGEIIYGDLLTPNDGGGGYEISDKRSFMGDVYEVDDNTIEMYSTFLDKNEKKLYTGDKVKFNCQEMFVTIKNGAFGLTCQEINYDRIVYEVLEQTGKHYNGCFRSNFISFFEIAENYGILTNNLDMVEKI